ncbi:DNA-directed RNA polymerase, mitochondrial isoform X2 [Maniola jurtina]|uniref:DNA-directed RNA polymerase, mitochondrial isoform X2 n=1 Tax=Maniola jurtina TaxID=191418 RepID=UPI001E68B38D|nr:DNA-directed RNA polymerase, mitochondrial isoform X2 [Maniola jurtina]
MHRLLSAKSLCQNNFHGVTLPATNSYKSVSLTQIKCSFCRKVLLTSHCTENLFLARHQSTRTVNAVRSLKKKTKHKGYKKYGELLQVNESSMTEMKVSISKLNASHLSKLASSPVSLGQLHQLTTKPPKNIEVDKELLQTVREKILKRPKSDIKLEDDKCALIFTNHKITTLEERFKAKQYIDMVKESYYNFRKATIYDQRLQDLRYAINEGLNQEFDFETKSQMLNADPKSLPKGPHAVFRELFIDNQLDSYDQELMSHIANLQMQGLSHPAIDEICDDSVHTEIGDVKEDSNIENEIANIKSLNVKKKRQAIKQKKKKLREKRRAAKEVHMKQDMREMERRGKQDSLHKLLTSHLQLLCSLDMMSEGRQVLQYYRQRSARAPEHPKVTSVKVYNTLLHGFASLGQLENVKELLSFMSEDQVEPNAQTFAAIFECVERSDLINKNLALHYYHSQMQEKGLTLNDLLDKTKFLQNQREVVLKAVRRLDPHFEPVYTPPALDYDCPLLENIKLENVENRKGLLTSPASGLLSLEDLRLKGKEQLAMEISGEIEVQNIAVKDETTKSVEKYREKYNAIEKEWRDVIHEAFTRNMSTLKSRSNASHSAITLYPYLKVLQIDQFVELIMSEISKLVDGSETYSPTLKLLQRDLGTQVYNKYQIEQFRRNGVLEKIEQIYEKYCKWYLERHPLDDTNRPYNGRQAWQLLVHQNREGASLNVEEAPWPVEIRQNIGKFLYNIIINDVKIDVNMFKQKAKVKKLPAVYKVHRPWGRLVRLELKPHPALSRLWASAARPQLKMRAALAPTRAPPAPWLAPTANGAYLLTATPLVRMPYFVMAQTKRLEEAPPASLYPVLDSLNQLGEVPWRINQPVLDLQMKIFRSGGDKKLDIPPPSSSLNLSQWTATGDQRPVAGDHSPGGDHGKASGDHSPANALRRRVAINRARAEMHSLWCDALYKLSLANHYRDRIFWLPHNMDFRGRVYAVGPHVSVLGADAARSLLQLAQQRPLGPRGLSWLKLHAINLTGTKKRSTVAERLAYADSIIDKILDSADNPLNGQGWWKKSEEPWQTLACCMEIANAMRSPNPEEYMCGFPVHQDGSCNGLQHYAALGGDAVGAAAVNLAPRDKPQDVYSEIAALVESMRVRDAAAGVPAAVILENFVRRKVIKQTVMTTVYGVTKFGARLQIAKQLKDIDDFPKDQVWPCSQYLTSRTFDSLREMFSSTKLIQDWFTDCAKVISGVCGESVEWVTPLGLPVLQPYYRRGPPTNNSAQHSPAAPVDLHQRPCTMKQRNAFPPNFIHSLDSSHMMLTALHCEAAAVTFVSVHDCFWTHPDTVDQMNQICREQFVALHSQPILENLSEFLVKRYSYPESELEDGTIGAANKERVNALLKKVPEKGDFDINSVLDSVYFFS